MIIVSKKPMREGLDSSVSFTYQDIDNAIKKFKSMCEKLNYEYKQSVIDSHPHYEAGGVGYDYRVELNVISSLLDKSC